MIGMLMACNALSFVSHVSLRQSDCSYQVLSRQMLFHVTQSSITSITMCLVTWDNSECTPVLGPIAHVCYTFLQLP